MPVCEVCRKAVEWGYTILWDDVEKRNVFYCSDLSCQAKIPVPRSAIIDRITSDVSNDIIEDLITPARLGKAKEKHKKDIEALGITDDEIVSQTKRRLRLR